MKQLYRSRKNRRLAGVCGGVGEYFGVEPVIVRLLFLALCSALGSGVLVYVIAALVMPEAPIGADNDGSSQNEETQEEYWNTNQNTRHM